MHFFTNWIFIVFEFGGLAVLLISLRKLSKLKGTNPTVDLKRFGAGIRWLMGFVILATLSLSKMMINQFGESGMIAQLIINLAMGIIFILSILNLTESIQPSDNP